MQAVETTALKNATNSYQQNNVDHSLEILAEALQRSPTNAGLRSAYLTYQERAVQDWLRQAQAMQNRSDAEALYKRVQKLAPGNAQAAAGLAALERQQRHLDIYKAASAAFDKQSYEEATTLLQPLLVVDPNDARALALQREVQNKLSPPLVSRMDAALAKTLTFHFKNATLQQMFEVMGMTSGVNFVFDKDVNGEQKTTVFLSSVTVKNALSTLLLTNQLEQKVLDENTILVYPNTPAKLKDYQALTVRTFFIAHIDVEQMANTLRTILKTRDLIVDAKQNIIIMRDTAEACLVAEKLVALQDRQGAEVMLELEVLEVNRDKLLDLGIDFPPNIGFSILPGNGTATALKDLLNLNTRNVGVTVSPLTVNARAKDSSSNVLANPRIRVSNRETAKILIGDKVPNITSTSTSTGFVSSNVQYLDVGLKLDVTPSITVDNEISIRIGLEVSNISSQTSTSSGTVAYQIGTRSTSTVLRLKDGETQILAGLINDEDRKSANKVPILSSLPLLGRIFTNENNSRKKSEIVLSITPHLIRNTQIPDAASLSFDSGTESNLRNQPSWSRDSQAPYKTEKNTPRQSTSATPAATGSAVAPAKPEAAGGTVNSPDSPTTENAPASGSTPLLLNWVGATQVEQGETFNVQLMANATRPNRKIAGIAYSIRYDPTVLGVINLSNGGFLTQDGEASNFSQRIDGGVGRILINDVRTKKSSTTQAPDSGMLFSLAMRAIGPVDTTILQVESIVATAEDGASLPTVTPAPLALKVLAK